MYILQREARRMGFVAYIGRWVKPIKKGPPEGGPSLLLYTVGLGSDAGPISSWHIKQLATTFLPLVNVVNVGAICDGRHGIN